jgi:phosphoribosyl 1,2-cyclic phosphodiesterase
LRYGGDTTCLEIRTGGGETIVVDAGTGIRRLGKVLVAEHRLRCHIIFTHAHWDHVMGFPFFKPIFMPRAELIMHKCPFQSRFVETILSKVMSPPTFPVRYQDLKASGYRFTENGRSFVFLTDNELGFVHPNGLDFNGYRDFCDGADLLIHDAEYTPEEYRSTREWGHSSYTDAVNLALAAKVRRLGLFHLNQDRTDDAMDRIVAACRGLISAAGADIECFGVASDMTFEV